MDPYKVLGVTPQTSDDDVKRAYRELARKYHPDNYVNNPLADLAETRMKEINEAYDMIMNERRNPAGGSSGQQQSYGGAYNGQQYGGYQQRRKRAFRALFVRQVILKLVIGQQDARVRRQTKCIICLGAAFPPKRRSVASFSARRSSLRLLTSCNKCKKRHIVA